MKRRKEGRWGSFCLQKEEASLLLKKVCSFAHNDHYRTTNIIATWNLPPPPTGNRTAHLSIAAKPLSRLPSTSKHVTPSDNIFTVANPYLTTNKWCSLLLLPSPYNAQNRILWKQQHTPSSTATIVSVTHRRFHLSWSHLAATTFFQHHGNMLSLFNPDFHKNYQRIVSRFRDSDPIILWSQCFSIPFPVMKR